MISDRARGVTAVLATREKLSARGGDGTAYALSVSGTIADVKRGRYSRVVYSLETKEKR
jgi:hypothetical protein